MTLLVSWIGVDTHGPTSAYIVADSRISWGLNSYFDYAKKYLHQNPIPRFLVTLVMFYSLLLLYHRSLR